MGFINLLLGLFSVSFCNLVNGAGKILELRYPVRHFWVHPTEIRATKYSVSYFFGKVDSHFKLLVTSASNKSLAYLQYFFVPEGNIYIIKSFRTREFTIGD
jgi:hypothetical protein